MKASWVRMAALVTAALAAWGILGHVRVALAGETVPAITSTPAAAPTAAPDDLPVGTLMPVAEIVEDTVYPWGFGFEAAVSLYSSSFAVAPADCGVVNSRAVVCKMAMNGSQKQWSAALDSRGSDDQTVNVLRLDVTGQNQFPNAVALPLRKQGGGTSSFRVYSTPVNLELDGRTIPVMVRGWYGRSEPASQPADEDGRPAAATAPQRYLSLAIGTAMAGTCRFGEKVYPVKLADANGNLILGEPVQVLGYSRGSLQVRNRGGDSVIVLSKEDGSQVSRALLGHPILVDGVWYDVKFGPGGTTMEAAARKDQTGQIVIDADKWSAMLIQGKTIYCISGGRQGVNVPAGEYDLVCYQPAATKGGNSYYLSISATSESKPETRRIKVEAGATLALQIGLPLKGIIASTVSASLLGERTLNTSLALRDVGDREVSMQLSGEPVKITIKDETGKVLTSGPVSYG